MHENKEKTAEFNSQLGKKLELGLEDIHTPAYLLKVIIGLTKEADNHHFIRALPFFTRFSPNQAFLAISKAMFLAKSSDRAFLKMGRLPLPETRPLWHRLKSGRRG